MIRRIKNKIARRINNVLDNLTRLYYAALLFFALVFTAFLWWSLAIYECNCCPAPSIP